MARRSPVSVLLPTVRRVDVIDQVAAQLEGEDELLVICDSEDDPVAAADAPDADGASALPDGVRLVVAGEPEGCSGKANAIAAGMEAARHERLVWTDDDFDHPPDWLARLRADYERHGPATELPFFRGRDPLAVLLEPWYALSGTAGVDASDAVWGGAVVFERGDLTTPEAVRRAVLDGDERDGDGSGADDTDGIDDEAAFCAALRRTVSDDGLLSEFLDATAVDRVRIVGVGGSLRETLERHVRFSEIVRRHEPAAATATGVVLLLLAAVSVFVPIATFAASTLLVGGVYARYGVRRWTFLLAFPAVLAAIPLALYVTTRRTFVWGGRRYRWRSKFDVEVVA